jgi:hypothetical protein
MELKVQEEDVRFPQADQATVQGSLVNNVGGATRTQKATLTLRNSGGVWTVESAKFE